MWHLTDDVETYAGRVWDLLASDPEASTVALTIIEAMRGGFRWSDIAPTFGWWELDDGTVAGAVSVTPPFPLLITIAPDDSLRALAVELRAAAVPFTDVHSTDRTASAFAEVWTDGTELVTEQLMSQRLYRLGQLRAPESVPGRMRVAAEEDHQLVARWSEMFHFETGSPERLGENFARERIESRTLALWESEDGNVVSMAGRRPAAAGVARIGPVYTPPEERQHGYGAAVTAACTQAALDAGAESVVLFADLANPTSNSIYQAIGYLPMSDRVVLRFAGSR